MPRTIGPCRSILAVVLLAGCAAGDPSPTLLARSFQLGELPDSIRPLLAEDCASTEEMVYDGAMAEPFTHQVQVDCQGLEVLGAPRKVEFMFNDGPLGHIWILTETSEADGLRDALVGLFGEVVYTSADYQVFEAGTVALRSDPAEILVATPALIEALTGYAPPEP